MKSESRKSMAMFTAGIIDAMLEFSLHSSKSGALPFPNAALSVSSSPSLELSTISTSSEEWDGGLDMPLPSFSSGEILAPAVIFWEEIRVFLEGIPLKAGHAMLHNNITSSQRDRD